MSKQKRINNIIKWLCEKRMIETEFIYQELGISEITLRRYLADIRKLGYQIKSRDGALILVKAGIESTATGFTKSNYTGFRILMYIYNNNPCSRDVLKENFCRECDELYQYGMSLRNLDLHISKLINNKIIAKKKDGNRIVYGVTDYVVLPEKLDFEKTLFAINHLKIYSDSLPFHEEIDPIIEKMEIACINHIRKSRDARENLLFTYEVFPDCIMEQSGKREDEIAKELEDSCIKGQILDIRMKSGGELRVIPFLIVFNWYLGCWYLVYRQTKDSDGEGYELLRLDRMKAFEKSVEPNTSQENIDAEIEVARQAVKDSFNISFEEPVNVKLLFLNPSVEEQDEIRVRMKNQRMLKEEIRDDLNYSIEVCVTGSSDFLSWIRRFGSRAMILAPIEMQQRHLDGVKSALSRWSS